MNKKAHAALANIPREQHNKIALFLESQGLKELALEVSTDPEQKFELAMGLKKFDVNN